MADHWNSEVFCAALNVKVEGAQNAAAKAENAAIRTSKSVHRLRGELEERDSQLAAKIEKNNLEHLAKLEKVNIENAKRAWVFPLVTSCVTALVVYLVMHAMKSI